MEMTKLPCYPCPHASVCCFEGAPLKMNEASALAIHFGSQVVRFDVAGGEWRTALANGTCIFQKDNACSIHAHAAYPTVCAGFPFRRDESEVDICPELLTGKHPELDALFDPTTKQLRVHA